MPTDTPPSDDKGYADLVTKVRQEAVELLRAQSALSFDSTVLPLTQNSPQLLVGYDQSRRRMLLRANTPDVFIGTMSQLQSGFGYRVNSSGDTEIKTVDEIYVTYNPESAPIAAPKISVWVEKATY